MDYVTDKEIFSVYMQGVEMFYFHPQAIAINGQRIE